MLRFPHCLYTRVRLTDCGKVVSPAHLPRSTLQNFFFFFASGTDYCERLSKPQGLVKPERIGKLEKNIHLIGSRSRNVSGYSIEPQALRYRVAPPMSSGTPPPTRRQRSLISDYNSRNDTSPRYILERDKFYSTAMTRVTTGDKRLAKTVSNTVWLVPEAAWIQYVGGRFELISTVTTHSTKMLLISFKADAIPSHRIVPSLKWMFHSWNVIKRKKGISEEWHIQ
jgi:hypothetical protein